MLGLDLSNAYGLVAHYMIWFAPEMYHEPKEITKILKLCFTGFLVACQSGLNCRCELYLRCKLLKLRKPQEKVLIWKTCHMSPLKVSMDDMIVPTSELEAELQTDLTDSDLSHY